MKKVLSLSFILLLLTFFSCEKEEEASGPIPYNNTGTINVIGVELNLPDSALTTDSDQYSIDIDNDGAADVEFEITVEVLPNEVSRYMEVNFKNGFGTPIQQGTFIISTMDTNSGIGAIDTLNPVIPRLMEVGQTIDEGLGVNPGKWTLASRRSWTDGSEKGIEFLGDWVGTKPYFLAFAQPETGVLGYVQIHVTSYSQIRINHFFYLKGPRELGI